MSANKNPFAAASRFGIALGFACLFHLFGAVICAKADSLEDVVHALVRKIMTPPGLRDALIFRCDIQSSNASGRLRDLCKLFERETERQHLPWIAHGAGPNLTLSFVETPSRSFLLASSYGTDNDRIWSVEIPRAELDFPGGQITGPRLERELVAQQNEPILAVAESPSSLPALPTVLTLSAKSLLGYRNDNGSWVRKDIVNFPAAFAVKRDTEAGFLAHGSGGETFFIDDQNCTASFAGDKPLSCDPVSAPRPARVSPPMIPRFKLTDCAQNAWTFQAGSGDWSVADHIRLADDERAIGDEPVRLDFPGPVQIVVKGADFRSAWVTVFNLGSGNYEVYRVTIACSH